jgi:RNA polymerase sigma-70 factor, ECF subfamily
VIMIALARDRSRIGAATRSASAGAQLDPEALGDHIDRLYRAARSMCASPQDAEDLVQETFVRVLKKPRKLRSENSLPYLLSVLRNTFISTHRAAARRPQTINQPEVVELLEDPRVAKVEAQIQAGDVYRAIGALPPDFRDAVAAVDLVGLSYRAAAVALHVREATITTRLYRGRQQIARALCDSFPDPPARTGRRRSDRLPVV